MFKAGVVAGVVLFASMGAARAEDSPTNKVEEKAPPRWAGSEVSLRHGYAVIGFDAAAEQTYNPVFMQVISIDPRWRLTNKITLTAHAGIQTELTDSDVTVSNRQPLLEDTFIQGSYPLPKLPWKLGGSVGLRLTLPTSMGSIARETIFAVAPSVAFTRPFQLTDKISLAAFTSLRVGATLATAQELTYDAPTIASCDAGSESCDQFNHSPTRSSFFALTETFGVDVGFPHNLSAQVVVSLAQSRLYACSDDNTGVMADPTLELPCDPDATNWRFTNIYLIEVGWEPIKHIRASGGFEAVNPQQKPDSSTYAPFFNRYTEVFLRGTYVF